VRNPGVRSDYLAIVRVRELIERRRRREREISILYSTARLTALRGVDEALESIVRSAHDLVDTDITYLTVLEEDGARLRVRAAFGSITPEFREDFHAPADVGIAGRVDSRFLSMAVAPVHLVVTARVREVPRHEAIDDFERGPVERRTQIHPRDAFDGHDRDCIGRYSQLNCCR